MYRLTRAANLNIKQSYPLAGKVFLAASGVLAISAFVSYMGEIGAKSEIQFRKQQLSKPVYVLSEQETVSPPWNESNINEWLFRRVEVTGRPIHRNACLVPTMASLRNGYEYVVPLLVQEAEDRSHQQGLLLSKGFLPFEFKSPGQRWRIEDVDKQTFTGYVSKLTELSNSSLTQGNATNERRNHYTCADLEDFVQTAGFVNQKQASTAIIEQLHETGRLDERSPQRRANDCMFTVPYPYAKTQSGALQLAKMPWDYRKEAYWSLVGSLASLVIGASIF